MNYTNQRIKQLEFSLVANLQSLIFKKIDLILT